MNIMLCLLVCFDYKCYYPSGVTQSSVRSQMEATGYALLKFIYFRLEFLFQGFLTCQNKFQLFPAIFTPACIIYYSHASVMVFVFYLQLFPAIFTPVSLIYYSHPSIIVFVLCVVDILKMVAIRCRRLMCSLGGPVVTQWEFWLILLIRKTISSHSHKDATIKTLMNVVINRTIRCIQSGDVLPELRWLDPAHFKRKRKRVCL